jgi:hypothetical protein
MVDVAMTPPPVPEEENKEVDTEVELPGETSDVEEHEDGSATVALDNEADVAVDPEFYANLAEEGNLDPADVMAVQTDLFDLVELDKEARKKAEEDYAEALKKTGLDGNPTGGADFPGAARATHPMVVEACVDFQSRAITELFPVGGAEPGPCKHYIVGTPTSARVEKAKRKSKFMNHQLMHQMPGFRNTLEQMLSQLGMSGQQFLKFYWDKNKKRPDAMFVPRDKVYYPFAAGSFEGAERKTHAQTMTELEFQKRVESGMYTDKGVTTAMAPERSAAEEASNSIDGKDDTGQNEDGERIIYETACFLAIEGDTITGGEVAPYLVSIEQSSQTVIAIYRNWDPSDPEREALDHLVEWGLIPWRETPVGITHLIGGLSSAATGALRALLDSAHVNNLPTALQLKGGSKGGQNITLKAGEIREIDGGTVGEQDIRKRVMPIPFNQPSPALFQLLGFLVEAGKGVVRTTIELAEENPNVPVGTTMANIEQGMSVFKAIHARMHQAMGRCLKVLHTLNRMHLTEDQIVYDIGELIVRRSDFEGAMDVVPVSDPNIFSEVQRTAQMQMIAQRAAVMPMLYDLRKVEELILERTKIPDAKSLLLPKPEPRRLNSLNENLAALHGSPIMAFPDQDHLAHLKVHVQCAVALGFSPLFGPKFVAPMMEHIKQHIGYLYVGEVVKVASDAAGVEFDKLMAQNDPEIEVEFDKALALAHSKVLPNVEEFMKGLDPVISQGLQLLQQFSPPTPMDPEVAKGAAAQAAQQNAQAKMMQVQQDGQAKQAAIQQKAQEVQIREEREARIAENQDRLKQNDQEIEVRRMAAESDDNMADRQADLFKNEQDNLTALTIAEGEWEHQEKVGVSTGTGINPSP